MLNMSDTIKARRRALGMTQESLAVLLGVSGPAVSKWEQGASYPDVTLLPALARALRMDLNGLMGFAHAPDKQEITRMLMQVNETAKAQGLDAGIQMAEEQLRKYPDCGPLLFGLAATIDGRMMMAGMNSEERAPYAPMVQGWYRRAADSEDEESRLAAAHLLASYALGRGDMDEAQEMLSRLPVERDGSVASRWPLDLGLLLAKGERQEAKAFLQKRLYARAADVQQMLLCLVQMAVDEGNMDRAESLAEVTQGVVTLLHLHPYTGHAARLMPTLAKRDAGAAIAQIGAMLSSLEAPWAPGEGLLYDQSGVKKSEHAGRGMLAGVIRELEESEEYAFLRKEEGFTALLAAYKGV